MLQPVISWNGALKKRALDAKPLLLPFQQQCPNAQFVGNKLLPFYMRLQHNVQILVVSWNWKLKLKLIEVSSSIYFGVITICRMKRNYGVVLVHRHLWCYFFWCCCAPFQGIEPNLNQVHISMWYQHNVQIYIPVMSWKLKLKLMKWIVNLFVGITT